MIIVDNTESAFVAVVAMICATIIYLNARMP